MSRIKSFYSARVVALVAEPAHTTHLITRVTPTMVARHPRTPTVACRTVFQFRLVAITKRAAHAAVCAAQLPPPCWLGADPRGIATLSPHDAAIATGVHNRHGAARETARRQAGTFVQLRRPHGRAERQGVLLLAQERHPAGRAIPLWLRRINPGSEIWLAGEVPQGGLGLREEECCQAGAACGCVG